MNDNINYLPVQEIIKSTPNGNLNDIFNLSSMQLVEKYVRPFYRKLVSTQTNSNLVLVNT